METKDGFLVINKEKGCTSHDCVKQIRVTKYKSWPQELLIQRLQEHYH